MRRLLLAMFCALTASLVSADTKSFDLRPITSRRGSVKNLTLSSLPDGESVLRKTSLPAGAAMDTGLTVGDILLFSLYDDVELELTITDHLENPLGGVSFMASVQGYDGMKNAVVLETPDGLHVDIQDFKNGRVYTVISTSEGVTVKEINPNAGTVIPTVPKIPNLPQVSSGSAKTSAKNIGFQASFSEQSSTLVDVLVAYDTPAAIWANANGGGITNFAQQSVAKMNLALANNGLDSLFRFRLVGTIAVAANGNGDLDSTLNAVTDGTGNWAPIRAMRNTVGADIVCTMIDTGSASGTTGLGWGLTGTTGHDIDAFSESAYNTLSVRAVAIGHTMTHETGHNMGAGHSDMQTSAPGPQSYSYSRGYYFTGSDDRKYHTIMAYGSDGYGNSYNEAPLFSDPQSAWQSVAAGNSTHNNAQVLRNTYQHVAQFRQQVIPMSYDVFFSPLSGAMFCGSLTLTLSAGSSDCIIKYTLDGSTPDATHGTVYTGPITITAETTVKAVAITDNNPGPVYEATYYPSDLGAALNAPQLVWETSSDYPWITQIDDTYDGVFAVQSATNLPMQYLNETTWLKTSVTGPATLRFQYKQRAHTPGFEVSVDDLVEFSPSSENDTWAQGVVNIPSGVHEVKFSWSLYGTSWTGFNGLWLDMIQIGDLQPPVCSQVDALVDSYPAYVTLLNPQATGVIYYTLDGTNPTVETGILYSGDPICISKAGTILQVAVFTEDSQSPVLYIPFKAISDIFGTSGVTWSRSGSVLWKEIADSKLKTGGLKSSSYDSVLTASVHGKGQLVFTYESVSYSSQNEFSFSINGSKRISRKYDGNSMSYSGTESYDITDANGATFQWRYIVANGNYDYNMCGAWLSDIQWIPDEPEPTDPFPPVEVSNPSDSAEVSAAVRSRLIETFSPSSEIIAHITTQEQLAALNQFAKDCGITSSSQITAAQLPFVYHSFVLSSVMTSPSFLQAPPELKITDFSADTTTSGHWNMTVSLKAGNQNIEMSANKLRNMIRCSASLDGTWEAPVIVSVPSEDGSSLTYTIMMPATLTGPSKFVKVKISPP